ncbi:MAG: hypothetical protein ACOQNV_01910 [Mycoplasmoidaceae bacterium]
MRKQYFKFVQIEKDIVVDFISRHQALTKFVNADMPFYVRVYKKPYAGLLHTIIGEGETSENLITKWGQLIDFAGKIKPEWVDHVKDEVLIQILGFEKASLIKKITTDIINKTLDLKMLVEQPDQAIINTLKQYQGLSLNVINTFALFTCFKQNILCDTDPDFIAGLKIFLNKSEILPEDINHIRAEYNGQLTLFSLCMWKIRNEKTGH